MCLLQTIIILVYQTSFLYLLLNVVMIVAIFTMLHTGDSNFKATQYTNILPHVNVLIPRYAPNALGENNILGTG